MNPPFRSKQEVIINAPLETVWEFGMDITRIPAFHPRVVKVELLSGKARREPGVSYRCHLSGGKHTCVEKDIEIIPMQKIVTVLQEDTFGISKIVNRGELFSFAGLWETWNDLSGKPLETCSILTTAPNTVTAP